MYVVNLVSRLPMQIVEETVTYGWSQGTSPYLVVTIYSKRPPCLNFAVYTGYIPSPPLPSQSYPSGIEWLSQSSFVSYAHSIPGNSGLVKNELASVDLRTGVSTSCIPHHIRQYSYYCHIVHGAS